MKNVWIVANWKSNKNIEEALDWVAKVGPQIPKENLKVVVCPTAAVLSEVKKAITVGNFPLLLGSQDLSPFATGAYTGEESASLLKELVNISILGHSERRKNFAEDDEMVAKKTQQALDNNITPLVCVQGDQTLVPKGCKLIAYEPVWAIGTGNPDTPQNASEVAIRLKRKYSDGLAVLYGGSVSSQNVTGFIDQENIDGVLVGNASLNPQEFIKIIQACSKD